jgi:hypothetical protein
MPRKQHTHKYHLVQTSSFKIWACGRENCNHYMPEHLTKLVEGRQSLCWKCENVLTLTEDNMYMPKPICVACMNKLADDFLPDLTTPKSTTQSNIQSVPNTKMCILCHAHPRASMDGEYGPRGLCANCGNSTRGGYVNYPILSEIE